MLQNGFYFRNLYEKLGKKIILWSKMGSKMAHTKTILITLDFKFYYKIDNFLLKAFNLKNKFCLFLEKIVTLAIDINKSKA